MASGTCCSVSGALPAKSAFHRARSNVLMIHPLAIEAPSLATIFQARCGAGPSSGPKIFRIAGAFPLHMMHRFEAQLALSPDRQQRPANHRDGSSCPLYGRFRGVPVVRSRPFGEVGPAGDVAPLSTHVKPENYNQLA